MIDYAQLLARAVATLDPNTREQRERVYERARKALADKFRTSDPPLPESAWRAESSKLEAAIARVELDVVAEAGPAEGPGETAFVEPGAASVAGGSRTRAGMVAATLAVLVLLVAGGMAWLFWPDIRSGARSTLRAPAAAPPRQQTDDRSYVYMRQLVYYRTNHPVGTLVVDKPQSFLYLVRPQLSAMRYTVRVAGPCAGMAGLYRVVAKEEASGGKETSGSDGRGGAGPLGPRALRLTEDRLIHGTGAGAPDVRACIGLVDDDIVDLYERTPVGSRVVVLSPQFDE